MSSERDLLRDLQAVLASAEVDVSAMVEGAWAEAQDEVRATLRRLMTRDLLARSLAALEGAGHDPVGPRLTPPETATATETETARGEPPPAEPAPALDQVTYLFGIVGRTTALPRTELPTVPGGGPLRLLRAGDVQAVACGVDPTTFDVLHRPDADGLDVLAAAAQAHDTVLARFVDAPVLPLPLGTVLPDDDAVTDLLRTHTDRLHTELERLTGVAEWAVTVRTLEDGPPAEDPQPPASGRDYLEARRAALDQRDQRWQEQAQLADLLHGALAACAVDAQEVTSRPLEGAVPPLFHGVYLVADDATDRFRSTVTYLRGEHPEAVVEMTGPWPPYHFTAVDLSAGEASAAP
ncbi:GvpL/GvpF family gas vesicle protein [Nitriliruptor alkaliphilus]|uniref:GvpL/GvpF family gas vesicle protein n=1 Tax=Nitriliruptor alkaliphilus TaxID=427918 RepID=UPI0006973C39|nr:GvpL/GvpF family gas vesicle protein [Nitriliruptor alkaliphilus]